MGSQNKVLSPKLVLEDNGAGSLSMKLPPMNVGYESIIRMITDISVQKDGEEIWAGRVLSESKDFWNNRDLYCEGEMAFFNDSSQSGGVSWITNQRRCLPIPVLDSEPSCFRAQTHRCRCKRRLRKSNTLVTTSPV